MRKIEFYTFLLLFLSTFSCLATETIPTSDVPSTGSLLLEPPDFYKKNPLPINLKQALVTMLDNNLDIRISDYDRRIAEAEIQAQKGIFDLLLSARTGVTNAEYQQPVRDMDGDPTVLKERQYYGEISLGQLLPTGGLLSMLYSTGRTDTNSVMTNISPYYNQMAALSFTQPFLKNFGPYVTLSGIRIAGNNARISREAFRDMVQSQVAELTRAYWDLEFAIENYEVQRLTLRQARDLLRITTISYKTGVLPETDVLQARAEVAAREEFVIVAESAIKAAEDYLKILMNIPRCAKDWNRFYLPMDKPEVRDIQLDTEASIREALENRPDYHQLMLDLKNREINRRVSWNRRLPELNFAATAGRSGLEDGHSDAWHELNTYDFHNYDFSLELKFPLQNREARYRYKQAALQFRQGLKQLENLENLIILDIRNAVRNIETERKRVEATLVSVESEKAKLDAEMKRYQVGMSTSYNVLEFQKDYSTALVNHIQSKINFNKAVIDLEKAKGTILSEYGILEVLDVNLTDSLEQVKQSLE